MPYDIRESGEGYKVFGPSGAKSKEPLSRAKAGAQMRALYASTEDEASGGGGGRRAERVGVRAHPTGRGGHHHSVHSASTPNAPGAIFHGDTPRLVAKHLASDSQAPARVGVRGGAGGPARCPVCGLEGCHVMNHVGTSPPPRARGGKRGGDDEGPHGPAREQAAATFFGRNRSPLATGNPEYEPPGSAAGLT